MVCPAETSIRSAPASLKRCATITASEGPSPAGCQSLAEIRTDIGRAAGHTARIAPNTSSGKRSRFSSEPPYSSVRRLVSGLMKADSR